MGLKVITFNTLVVAYTRGRQWAFAVQMLAEMRRSSVNPDAVTLAAISGACAVGRCWEGALSLMPLALKLKLPTRSTPLHSRVLSAVALGHCWEQGLAPASILKTRPQPLSAAFDVALRLKFLFRGPVPQTPPWWSTARPGRVDRPADCIGSASGLMFPCVAKRVLGQAW